MITTKTKTLLFILLTIIIIAFSLSKSEESFAQHKFELYNLKGDRIKNVDWENDEQEALEKYLRSDDHVLQLGGNIGASCIYADKILGSQQINYCVEPNPKIISVLKKNKDYHKANFEIIEGVISNKTDLKIQLDSSDNNYWGTTVQKNGDIPIKSFSLDTLKGYKSINVLFADCEGCLETFIDEYPWFVDQLRLIIYEDDYKETCDYGKLEVLFQKNGFKKMQSDHVTVWLKK